MAVSGMFVVRCILLALACIFAFFLFRAATDIDLRPWLATGTVGCAVGALFPWPQ